MLDAKMLRPFGFHEMDVMAELLDEHNEVIFDAPQLQLGPSTTADGSVVSWVASRPVTIGAIRLCFRATPDKPFLMFQVHPLTRLWSGESITLQMPAIHYNGREQ